MPCCRSGTFHYLSHGVLGALAPEGSQLPLLPRPNRMSLAHHDRNVTLAMALLQLFKSTTAVARVHRRGARVLSYCQVREAEVHVRVACAGVQASHAQPYFQPTAIYDRVEGAEHARKRVTW